MNTHNIQLMIVEDERDLCRMMSLSLQQAGFKVTEAHNGKQALEFLSQQRYDVVLTDIMMPGMSGVRLMERIHEDAPATAVILMTGVPSIDTAVEAIKAGAHGYLMKPFSDAELRTTIENALAHVEKTRLTYELVESVHHNILELGEIARKLTKMDKSQTAAAVSSLGKQEPESVRKWGTIKLYSELYQIATDVCRVDLTPTEFDLLTYLISHRHRVVSCSELVQRARGYSIEEDEAREVIRPHISNLRRKLKQVGHIGDPLVNVRGLGYRLADIY